MKVLVILCLAIAYTFQIKGQQQPHYTQYIINQYILNPAITGIENYTDIKISHRHQWAGLQDAPVTTYLSFHKPLGKQDDRTTATSFNIPGENPRGKAYWEQYQSASPHHGVGVKMINDRTGPLNRLGAYFSYAYHIGISASTSLAAGFEGGLRILSLNRTKLDFGSANPLDPAVYQSGQINQVKPDFGAGLYLYSRNYFAGLSAQQIIPQKIYYADLRVKAGGSKSIPHLFATAGYLFFFQMISLPCPRYLSGMLVPYPFNLILTVKCNTMNWPGRVPVFA